MTASAVKVRSYRDLIVWQRGMDHVHHLSFANGSLMELETELLAATRLDYVPDSDIQPALQTAAEVGRMLAGLIRKLRP